MDAILGPSPVTDDEKLKTPKLSLLEGSGPTSIEIAPPQNTMLYELNKGLDELEGYDPESAKVYGGSLNRIEPDMIKSQEDQLLAEKEALDYYENVVMPGIEGISKKAIDVKSRTNKPNFTAILFAGLIEAGGGNGTAFWKAYSAQSENRFNSERERELGTLQEQAAALERAMTLRAKKIEFGAKTLAWSGDQLKTIQAKIEYSKKKFALSQLPALQTSVTSLGNQLLKSMLDPSQSVNMSKDAVLDVLSKEASRLKIGDISKFSDKQKDLLYELVTEGASKHATTLYTSYANESFKRENLPKTSNVNYSLVSDLTDSIKNNDDAVTNEIKSIELLAGQLDGSNANEQQRNSNKALRRQKDDIYNTFNNTFSSIDYYKAMPSFTKSGFLTKLLEFQRLDNSERESAVDTYLTDYTSDKIPVDPIINLGLNTDYNKDTVKSNILKMVSGLDKISTQASMVLGGTKLEYTTNNLFQALYNEAGSLIKGHIAGYKAHSKAHNTKQNELYTQEVVDSIMNNQFFKDAFNRRILEKVSYQSTLLDILTEAVKVFDPNIYRDFINTTDNKTNLEKYNTLTSEEKDALYKEFIGNSVNDNNVNNVGAFSFSRIPETAFAVTNKDGIYKAKVENKVTKIKATIEAIKSLYDAEKSLGTAITVSNAILPAFNIFTAEDNSEDELKQIWLPFIIESMFKRSNSPYQYMVKDAITTR